MWLSWFTEMVEMSEAFTAIDNEAMKRKISETCYFL